MKKMLLAFIVFASISATAQEKTSFDQIAAAAHVYTSQYLQNDFDTVHDYISSAVTSITKVGGIMNDTIYSVELSGCQVTSSGMIVGPSQFKVTVFVDNTDCQISKVQKSDN